VNNRGGLGGGGSADGASLSMGAPLGEPGGGLLVGDPVMKGGLQRREPLYMGALLGQPVVGSSTGTSRYGLRGSGDGVSLSLSP
jgi:hypothetical protein